MSLLKNISTCSDLNRISGYNRPLLRRTGDVFWSDGVFSTHATTSMAEIPNDRRPLSRRLQSADLSVFRAFSGHGFCTTDLSREPARHRGLPASHGTQALSHGHPQHGVAQQPFERKRESGLAHLRRVCAGDDPAGQKALCGRFQIPRSRRDGLCPRFEHDRSLHDALSLGAFPGRKAQ